MIIIIIWWNYQQKQLMLVWVSSSLPQPAFMPRLLLFIQEYCNTAIMIGRVNHMTKVCLERLITTIKSDKAQLAKRESVED